MLKKRIISVFLLMFIFISCFSSQTIAADNKEYSFESAKFYVELNQDGSANVKEVWTVNYKSGTFSRFYKNIYTNLPKSAAFDIKFNNIIIDGKECLYTPDTESRKDYTYSLIKDSDTIRYEVYVTSQNQTREYQISYTLYDVVKYVNNDYYWFEYRFLPEGYKETILNFDIEIKTFDGCPIDISTNKGTYVDGSVATVTGKNVSKLFILKSKIECDDFDVLKKSSHITEYDLYHNKPIPQKEKGNFSSLIFEIYTSLIIIVLFLAIASIFIKNPRLFKTEKIKNEICKNPDLVTNLITKYTRQGFLPADITALCSGEEYLNYFVYLADLVNMGIVTISSDYQYVDYPVVLNYLPYQNEILNILEDCRIHIEKKGYSTECCDGYWHLPMSYIERFFASEPTCIKVECVMTKILNMKIEHIQSITPQFNINELNKDVEYISTGIKMMHKKSEQHPVELSEVIYNYKYDPLVSLRYCLCMKQKSDGLYRDASAYVTLFAINLYNSFNQYRKPTRWDKYDGLWHAQDNRSNYSGCSGCSSGDSGSGGSGCGGCGGVD